MFKKKVKLVYLKALPLQVILIDGVDLVIELENIFLVKKRVKSTDAFLNQILASIVFGKIVHVLGLMY
jgi:hypothetical protein